MKKEEFLKQLRKELKGNGLNKSEIERAISYYLELIDEAIEGGESERMVIKRLGEPSIVAIGIKNEIDSVSLEKPMPIVRENKVKRKRSIVEIILLAFAFVIFVFPIFIAIASALFAVGIAMFAVSFALVVSGLAIPIYGIILSIISTSIMVVFTYLCAGFLCLSLGLLAYKFLYSISKLCFKGIMSLGKASYKIFS